MIDVRYRRLDSASLMTPRGRLACHYEDNKLVIDLQSCRLECISFKYGSNRSISLKGSMRQYK